MKILYLADAQDIHTARLVKYFARRDNEVHIASFRESADYCGYGNIHTHLIRSVPFRSDSIAKGMATRLLQKVHLGTTFFDPFYAVIQMKNLISEINPDIMHCQSIVSHTIVGSICGFHPMVLSPMGNDIQIYPKQSRIVYFVVRSILKEADAIIAEGENLRDEMVKLGAETARIRVVNRGVDRIQFNPSQRDAHLREQLGILDSPAIITTRRMSAIHDVETLIRAIPLVLKSEPNAKFVVVGDGERKRGIEELAVSLGVSKSVRFVGMIRHEDLPKYLSSSDIYVSTSLSDGCSVSTLEALASHLAPVVTDVGNHRRLIRDGVDGFVVPPGDVEILADRLITLLKNDDVRRRFAQSDHGIGEYADFEKEMAKIRVLYGELAAGG